MKQGVTTKLTSKKGECYEQLYANTLNLLDEKDKPPVML